MTTDKHRYEIWVPNKLHWVLVKLAAENEMHQEDYVEAMIKEHAEFHLVSEEIRKSIETINDKDNCWVDKLNIKFIESDDEGFTVNVEWDEKDPELEMWTSWSEQKQKDFILGALTKSFKD